MDEVMHQLYCTATLKYQAEKVLFGGCNSVFRARMEYPREVIFYLLVNVFIENKKTGRLDVNIMWENSSSSISSNHLVKIQGKFISERMVHRNK